MNVREQGFLLLTGFLGDPERKPLTIPQLRKLTHCGRTMPPPGEDKELTVQDLEQLGLESSLARKVVQLLSQEEQLSWYLQRGKRAGCFPVTRISNQYPHRLRRMLELEAPGCLWMKGDMRLLELPAIAVVGSRDLQADNQAFAEEVGRQAALQGYVLVSGNARGADRTAQESCLAHGGSVICVVADALGEQPQRDRVLYVSEEGFDLPFTAQRALQRNRIIHSMTPITFVAQCSLGKGGTWKGTCDNLRYNRSLVACFDDGSDGAKELECRGAVLTDVNQLADLTSFVPETISFLQE